MEITRIYSLTLFYIFTQWNGSTIHHFEVDRDFGTDYGICCWFTPQFNFTKILKHSHSESLEEPDWGFWFTQIQKVNIFHLKPFIWSNIFIFDTQCRNFRTFLTLRFYVTSFFILINFSSKIAKIQLTQNSEPRILRNDFT